MTNLSDLINAYWDALAEAGPVGAHEVETALVKGLEAMGATKVQAKALVRGMKDNGPEPEQEPEDPDLQRVRDIVADWYDAQGLHGHANAARDGLKDEVEAFKRTFKALKLGRDLERSERPAEPAWIEWHGGSECPVPEGVDCEVKLRRGAKLRGRKQRARLWGHIDSPHDILFYRVWPS